jgi:hypothetical protein
MAKKAKSLRLTKKKTDSVSIKHEIDGLDALICGRALLKQPHVWIQGNFHAVDYSENSDVGEPVNQYCAVGAVRCCANGVKGNVDRSVGGTAATNALSAALPGGPAPHRYAAYAGDVIDYNDDPTRTLSDIIRLFGRAVKYQRARILEKRRARKRGELQ